MNNFAVFFCFSSSKDDWEYSHEELPTGKSRATIDTIFVSIHIPWYSGMDSIYYMLANSITDEAPAINRGGT